MAKNIYQPEHAQTAPASPSHRDSHTPVTVHTVIHRDARWLVRVSGVSDAAVAHCMLVSQPPGGRSWRQNAQHMPEEISTVL